MIKSGFDNTSLAYMGGNETNRGRPIWEIARDYNQESREKNGAVTCIYRHQTTKKQHKRILG